MAGRLRVTWYTVALSAIIISVAAGIERIRLSSSSSSEDQDNILLDEVLNETPGCSLSMPSSSKQIRATKNIMTSRLSAALDKCKISDRDAVHLLTAAAESFQVNCLEFTINRSTIKRAREIFRKQSSEAIKSTFIDQNLDYIIVHWDSKLLPDILSKENVDRLPVIASASNVEKLLGVPALTSGTGKEISSAVYNLLLDWNLVDKVQAFVFDTTASNSGRLNGACVLLEQLLNRNILFFACRHHIFEIVLQAVFAHVKITVMSGPDIPLFKRFKNYWKNIDLSNFRTYSTFQNSQKNLKDVANDISLFCIQKLNNNFPRDDYREFLELVLIFLGGSPPHGIKFRQPGAYHLARWMAKAIYCIKILIFSDQFKITTREQISLDEVCCFIVKCYIQEWITAPDPVTAPMNDLLFLNKLNNYNDKLGEVAIRKFINHLWYLNEECAVFSIFDDRVNNETKQRMTKKILEGKEQYRSKGALKLLKLDVPRWADLRTSVTLNCQYDTGGDSLYSVKWYKDDHEFFRYTPGLNPKTLVFHMDGVNVDESKSSSTEVTLFPLTRMSSGNYKCEVSTDAPNFPTEVEDANMTVIAFPEDGPKIEGLRQWYAVGDYLEANCTAKMTFPVAEVTWYINNERVDSYLLERYSHEISDGPFYNSTLGLRFPLKKEWLDMNKNKMDVKCTAKVDGADVKVDEMSIHVRPVTDHTLSQERHIFNTGAVITNHWAIILTTFILHYYGAYN